QAPAVRRGQAMGVVLHAQALAGKALLGEERAQVLGRVAALAVDPDPDVLDDRGVPRLAQIRRAGEQDQIAVRAQHQALEEAVAERVVAGEPVHALLLEQEHAVEPPRRHRLERPLAARGELFAAEVQSHGYLARIVTAIGSSTRGHAASSAMSPHSSALPGASRWLGTISL